MHGDLAAWLEATVGTDEEFVERAWRLVVRRPVEPEVGERTAARLGTGELSRSALIRDVVDSSEFAEVALLDDAVAHAAAERAKPREVRGPARPRHLSAPAGSDERTP